MHGIVLETSGRRVEVDARPSDAVAMALRAESEIRVNEKLLEHSSDVSSSAPVGEDSSEDQDQMKKWQKVLEELDPDSIKYKI